MPTLADITRRLCAPESYEGVHHRPGREQPMPAVPVLADIVARLKAILFPGYFGTPHGPHSLGVAVMDPEMRPESMAFHVGAELDNVYRLLAEQIRRGHRIDEVRVSSPSGRRRYSMDNREGATPLSIQDLSSGLSAPNFLKIEF